MNHDFYNKKQYIPNPIVFTVEMRFKCTEIKIAINKFHQGTKHRVSFCPVSFCPKGITNNCYKPVLETKEIQYSTKINSPKSNNNEIEVLIKT